MALSNGYYNGKGLSLEIDGVEYNMDVSNVNVVSEDSGRKKTFADVTAGTGKDWYLEISGYFDAATGSLWRLAWDSAGEEDVPYVVSLYGNAAPAAGKPHVVGTCTIGDKPDFGGEADSDWEFTVRWKIDGTPALDETP